MPIHLFVYGTLHPDRAPAVIAHAARRLIPLGPATIRARLHHLGEYPGAILDPSAPPLPGELFVVPDTSTLVQLDAYEDFRPNSPPDGLFLRAETTATRPDGSHLTCWVYLYNRDPPPAIP